MNARPSPLQLPALSPNGYSVLVLAVFRAEADEEVAGSFFAAVPGLPGSGAEGWEAAFTIFQSRVGHVPPGQLPATMAVLLRPGTVLAPEFPGGHLAPMELPAPFAAGLRDVFGRL